MILICFGTRPEWLKVKPLVNKLERGRYKLLFTGQHEDLLKGIDVDYKISIGSNLRRLDQIFSDCILQFPEGDFSSVLVQGDTASALGCALAAFHRKIKIYYLEAGLRSYNLQHPYPEEAYRQMISRISAVNLCPTELSEKNLSSELVSGKTHCVGNTVLDNLLGYKVKEEYTNTVLVTLHRRENWDFIQDWFSEINSSAIQYPELEFVFPMHPNPNIQKHKHILTHVTVTKPLNHEELLTVLVKAKFVISDSGGLQEEGSFFNKKVIVCRKTTERPEGISTGHLIMCDSPTQLRELVDTVNKNYAVDSPCPYGDGHSAERIIRLIEDNII